MSGRHWKSDIPSDSCAVHDFQNFRISTVAEMNYNVEKWPWTNKKNCFFILFVSLYIAIIYCQIVPYSSFGSFQWRTSSTSTFSLISQFVIIFNISAWSVCFNSAVILNFMWANSKLQVYVQDKSLISFLLYSKSFRSP